MTKTIKVILFQFLLFLFSCAAPEEKSAIEQSKIDSFSDAEANEALRRADEMIKQEKTKDSLNLKPDSSVIK